MTRAILEVSFFALALAGLAGVIPLLGMTTRDDILKSAWRFWGLGFTAMTLFGAWIVGVGMLRMLVIFGERPW